MDVREEESWDLFSNGNYVRSFGSKEDLGKFLEDLVADKKLGYWSGTEEEIEKRVAAKMNDGTYHVVKSVRLSFGPGPGPGPDIVSVKTLEETSWN